MAFSKYTLLGDGSTTQFPINFTLGYLSRDDVQVQVGGEVDGSGDPVYRTLTWITDSLVEVGGTVPANQEEVVFTRTVSKTTLQHDFSDGAPITEQNLDDSHLQTIMQVHEVLDGRFTDPFEEDLNMGGNTVTNIGEPVEDSDAVPKGYADENYGGAAATAARNWAITEEDILVPEGNQVDEYSAKHYSIKAGEYVSDVNSILRPVSSFVSLADAITHLGSTKATLLVDTTVTLTGNVTVPSNITLSFLGDGYITGGFTLEVAGPIVAGAHHVFDTSVTVTGHSTSASSNTFEVLAAWWGARHGTDSTVAIQKALDFAAPKVATPVGRVVRLGTGQFTVSSTLTMDDYVALVGEGKEKTILYRITDYGDTLVVGSSAEGTVSNPRIEGVWFWHNIGWENGMSVPGTLPGGITTTDSCHVRAYGVVNALISDCSFWNLEYPMILHGGSDSHITRCTFRGVWDHAESVLQQTKASIDFRYDATMDVDFPTSMTCTDCKFTGYLSASRTATLDDGKQLTQVENIGPQQHALLGSYETILFQGCEFGGANEYAINVNVDSTAHTYINLRVDDCFFDGNRVAPIYMSNGLVAERVYNTVVSNCNFTGQNNSLYAVYVPYTDTATTECATGLTISGNTMTAYTRSPVRVESAAGLTVSGNNMRYYDSAGLYARRSVTGATQTNPVVITATAHGYENGDEVYLTDVSGMVEINDQYFTVSNKTANTFELTGVDGTGYTAYTSGGYTQEPKNSSAIFLRHLVQDLSITGNVLGGGNAGEVYNGTTVFGENTVYIDNGVSNYTVVGNTDVGSNVGQSVTDTLTEPLYCPSINTGQGATSVYPQDQDMRTSSTPTFDEIYLGDSIGVGLRMFDNGTHSQIIGGWGRGTGDLQFYSSTGAAAFSITPAKHFIPAIDNTQDLGSGSNRLRTIYAGTGTINTSDERTKTPIVGYTPAERAAAQDIGRVIGKFKFRDAVADKGTGARWHFGVGAQTVQLIMEQHGLDATQYGFFCYDEWEEYTVVTGTDFDTGKVETKTVPAGSRYGIRYDELVMFMMGAL